MKRIAALFVVVVFFSGCSMFGGKKKGENIVTKGDKRVMKAVPSTKPPKEDDDEWFAGIRQKLEKNPKDAGSWVEYGNYLFMRGYSLLAERMYDRALALKPKSIRALNNKAALAYAKGENDVAFELLMKVAKIDEWSLKPKLNLARFCLEFSMWKKARNLYIQIEDMVMKKNLGASYLKEARVGIAVSSLAIGKIKDAGNYFARVEPHSSPGFNTAYNYGRYLLRTKGMTDALDYVDDYRDEFAPGSEERKKMEEFYSMLRKGTAK